VHPKAKRDTKSLLGDYSSDEDTEVKEVPVVKSASLLDASEGGCCGKLPDPGKLTSGSQCHISSVIDDFQVLTLKARLTPALSGWLDRSFTVVYPIVELSRFWLLKDYWTELNETV
jgi:hypothetical protein